MTRCLADDQTIGLAWTVLLSFLRIITDPRNLPRLLTSDQALARMGEWLEAPPVVILHPGVEHLARLRELLNAADITGALVMDARLAALALDHHAVIVSYDRDFGRLPGITWEPPEI